jgi:hypothetical protein
LRTTTSGCGTGTPDCSPRALEPVDQLAAADDLPRDEAAAREALERTIVMKLNGGLGTSMRLKGPKSLLPVKQGLTFFDLIARQILQGLANLLDGCENILELPLIVNRRPVEPADPSTPEAIQLESAMGAATGVFEGAQALRVPRRRFAPVKTTDDLLAVRSDARFPAGPPSLVACQRLGVRGDVRFGRGVVARGEVTIEHTGAGQVQIEDGAVLDGNTVSQPRPGPAPPAVRHVRSVFTALGKAASRDSLSNLAAQLSADFHPLLEVAWRRGGSAMPQARAGGVRADERRGETLDRLPVVCVSASRTLRPGPVGIEGAPAYGRVRCTGPRRQRLGRPPRIRSQQLAPRPRRRPVAVGLADRCAQNPVDAQRRRRCYGLTASVTVRLKPGLVPRKADLDPQAPVRMKRVGVVVHPTREVLDAEVLERWTCDWLA